MTISRRGFLGLLAGAVAARAVPKPVAAIVEPEVVFPTSRTMIDECYAVGVGVSKAELPPAFIYGLPYWCLTEGRPYLGIDRRKR